MRSHSPRVLCRLGSALALLALAGCPALPTPPTATGQAATFSLAGPEGPVTVMSGQDKTVEITATWKGAEREPIDLTAEVEPRDQGVTVSLPASRIPADKTSAGVTISVRETALAGDYKVKVTGKARATSASTTLTVKVPAM